MRRSRALTGLCMAVLVALLGCRSEDGAGGSTAGTALYLFDQSSQAILVWNDMETVYSASTPPAADKTLTADPISSSINPLAWGGLTLDPNRNQLYLVSASGTVVRVNNLRNQTGKITTTTDLATFTLDSTNRLAGSVFGQASVDPQSGALFITETGTSSTRIWVVANAGSIGDTMSVTGVFLAAPNQDDTSSSGSIIGAAGVAAAQGSVFAYMEGGATITNLNGSYTGPRLRRSADGSTFNSVIIGSSTQLEAFGTLAYDTANATVYVGVNTTVQTTGTHPVLAFKTGAFSSGFDEKPDMTLDTPAVTNLRVLAHAGSKDWLVGLKGTPGTGGGADTAYGDLIMWKSPASGGTTGASITLPGTALFRGAALDGSGG